jgi:hypothetical protein
MDCINLQALGDSSHSESLCSYSNELTNFENLQSDDSNNLIIENDEFENQNTHTKSVSYIFKDYSKNNLSFILIFV